MDPLSLFCFLILIFHVDQGLSSNDCRETRCGRHAPLIRFPFRLKDKQPDYCGYRGFDLSCTDTRQTLLVLPGSVRLYVDRIDYVSQTIYASDPDQCLPRQLLNFNLSSTPFEFGNSFKYDYVFFNCTSIDRREWLSMPCLSVPGYDIHAFTTDIRLDGLALTSCTRMFNVSGVPNEFISRVNVIRLTWTQPNCGFCEEQNKFCRMNTNGTKPEVECYKKPQGNSTKRKLIVTGAALGSFLLLVTMSVLYWKYRSDKADKENQARIEKFLEDYKAMKPTRYLYADIKGITNGFKDKLGQGAYGTVFKGKLSNEIFVAVKVLNNSTGNGEEFINEVGTMGRIYHVNVVRLVGYCADGFRRALVYEYLPNESLEKFITPDHGKTSPFNWQKLNDIALGIAKGIEYLHHRCEQRILHFDIKPQNILLDENFNPKISDFGLSKLCSKDQSAVSMKTARGTVGYIAPEVFSRNFGNVSYKSDVYSFGMVLLEMVGRRKNVNVTLDNTTEIYFPEWAYKTLDQGEDLRIQIEEESDAGIVKKLTIVGLWCIQWNPADRPSMSTVVQMLEGGNIFVVPPNPFSSTGTARAN